MIVGTNREMKSTTILPALAIAPGLRPFSAKEFSVTTEFPVSGGFLPVEEVGFLGVDLQAALNLNFGYGSSLKSAAGFGISLGGGIGYHYSFNDHNDNEVSVKGYVFQTTFCFRNRKPNKDPFGAGIRIFYMSDFAVATIRKSSMGISWLAFHF